MRNDNSPDLHRLIARREKLTSRRDGLVDGAVISLIDTQLSEVTAGVDNRVDKLLGRPEAVLPERAEYQTQSIQHMHQCGWCGEWYIGARVDHGCPAPKSEQIDQAEQAERDEWLTRIMDQHEDRLDFLRLCGDLAI